MLLLFAPIFTLIALISGGIATVAAIIVNGPRRLRSRGEPPLVALPPIPTPSMRQLVEETEKERIAL